jgi:hypothetical protein
MRPFRGDAARDSAVEEQQRQRTVGSPWAVPRQRHRCRNSSDSAAAASQRAVSLWGVRRVRCSRTGPFYNLI